MINTKYCINQYSLYFSDPIRLLFDSRQHCTAHVKKKFFLIIKLIHYWFSWAEPKAKTASLPRSADIWNFYISESYLTTFVFVPNNKYLRCNYYNAYFSILALSSRFPELFLFFVTLKSGPQDFFYYWFFGALNIRFVALFFIFFFDVWST